MAYEIPHLRNQGTHFRPLVWTADGRPHPAVTRTLQCAADIASSRNGQRMSAKTFQHRWKHEIQVALFRRRAAVTRAVLPNPSARAKWLLASLIDRALKHGGHAPLLTVEMAMTTMRTQRQILPCQTMMMTTTSPQSPVNHLRLAAIKLLVVPAGPLWGSLVVLSLMFPGNLELHTLFEDHGVSCAVIEDFEQAVPSARK